MKNLTRRDLLYRICLPAVWLNDKSENAKIWLHEKKAGQLLFWLGKKLYWLLLLSIHALRFFVAFILSYVLALSFSPIISEALGIPNTNWTPVYIAAGGLAAFVILILGVNKAQSSIWSRLGPVGRANWKRFQDFLHHIFFSFLGAMAMRAYYLNRMDNVVMWSVMICLFAFNSSKEGHGRYGEQGSKSSGDI